VLLSLVAIDSGRVVGHVLYSPLSIADVSGAALGPLAVRPDYQRTGIGTLLVEAGNRRLAQARCPFIVVVGHAEYYPRFGFTRASDYGVTCEFDVPDDVFMIFAVDRSKVPSGRAKYRHEFSTVK
jgi:putative acetyltransferase